MDMETLKERIEALDPVLHRALRRALMAEYERRAGGLHGRREVDLFEVAFRKAAGDIAERYVRGTSDYVREHDPDLFRRTEEADKRMNETWAAGRQGKATIDEFRGVLRQWQLLHLDGIDLFAKHQARPSSPAESVTGE